MANFVFANNVSTTLASPITTTTQTTVTLTSTANLPTLSAGQTFVLTLCDAATQSVFEILYVSAISGATLTVVRGQEGTAATTWLSGDYAYGSVTAAMLGGFATTTGVVTGITPGTGISSTGGADPTISNTGILTVTAGSGLGSTGGQSPTLSNSGVLSLATLTGALGVTSPGNSIEIGTSGSNVTLDDYSIIDTSGTRHVGIHLIGGYNTNSSGIISVTIPSPYALQTGTANTYTAGAAQPYIVTPLFILGATGTVQFKAWTTGGAAAPSGVGVYFHIVAY